MEKMRLQLSNVKKNKILVVGDIMMDRYFTGRAVRISPDAPVPVFDKTGEYIMLGGAANVAANLSAAYQMPSIASVIGTDKEATQLVEMLKSKNICTNLIMQDSSRITTVKTRILGQNNQPMFRIDREERSFLSKELEEKFLETLLHQLNNYTVIIISDYLKGVMSYKVTTTIINAAKKLNKIVMVDVKGTDPRKYQGAYLLKPNKIELQALTGNKTTAMKDVVVASRKLRELCQANYVLTTQGRDGMTLLDKEDNVIHVDSIAHKIHDSIGAGDTVIAYLAVGLVNGLSVNESVRMANDAAGISTMKAGTTAVSLEEVIGYKEDSRMEGNDHKIVQIEELAEHLKGIGNKRVVFANGCFDILHRGHLQYLKESSKLGDLLIVGVNSDNSVRRIKGDNRPIMEEADRMHMVAALECVDYVVKFDEDTPIYLIQSLHPDVVSKGGDYLINEVVGREIVESGGGEVVITSFEEGQSTTNIINKILERYTRIESRN